MFRALFVVGVIASSLCVTPAHLALAIDDQAAVRAAPGPGAGQTPPGPAFFDQGRWVMPESPGQAESPQVAIGPDDFGYTLSDAAPFTWLGATSGISISFGGQTITGPVSLPFNFKFYENTYNQVYISKNGNLRFGSMSGGDSPAYTFPSTKAPNNVIAPYWVYMADFAGGVFYRSGGIAPNRWFVVEWHQVEENNYDTPNNQFTFEAVLYESGNIEFHYLSMSYAGGGYVPSIGIEDSLGYDGLGYPFLSFPYNNMTLRFTRPAPSTRVGLGPKSATSFATLGSGASYLVLVRNTGELGADTYDFQVASTWPVSLRTEVGVPLADTNGNGLVDTGPLAQGQMMTVTARFVDPPGVQAGNTNSATLTARSARNTSKVMTATFRMAIPAPFALSYVRQPSGSRPYSGVFWPGRQITQALSGSSSGWSGGIATLGNGQLAQAWSQFRLVGNWTTVQELYYALLNTQGTLTRGPQRLTDLSSAAMWTEDSSPAITAAPNGNLGVTWSRTQTRSSDSASNENVYFMVLNAAGAMVVPPISITNNIQWGTYYSPTLMAYSSPSIVATVDNRFVIAWSRMVNSPTHTMEPWYTVRAANGSTVKPPTVWGIGECPGGVWALHPPDLVRLADGSIFVANAACRQVHFGRLNSAGMILTPQITYTTDISTQPNLMPTAVQLPGGNILLAWNHGPSLHRTIQYAVLNSSLATVRAPTTLPSLSPLGDGRVAVTHAGDRGILVWEEDGPCTSLYYAQIDAAGNLVVPTLAFAHDESVFLGGGRSVTHLPPDATPPTNPTLASPTHSPGAWSNNNAVTINLTGASDAGSGVNGYSVAWDHAPSTLPDIARDTGSTTIGSGPLAEGDWYVHARTLDNAGNWTPAAAHAGPFRIDRTAPTNPTSLVSTSHVTGAWSADNTVDVRWSGASDARSGVGGYSIAWNQQPSTVPDGVKDIGAITATTSAALGDGDWYVHLRAVDRAGNWAAAAGARHLGPFRIDRTAPGNPTALVSTSHLTGAWSADTTVNLTWAGATDARSGLDGYSIVWDRQPATVPDAIKDAGAVTGTTSPALTHGDGYVHLRAVDKVGNWNAGAKHFGPFRIDTTPPMSHAWSPAFSTGAFQVSWFGEDIGSGVSTYDVWVRDGVSGTWTAWLTGTTETNAVFDSGSTGHVYSFRSRARDAAGNVEVNVPAGGDTNTTLAAYELSGRVTNQQGEPVFNAQVAASPAALNEAATDGAGAYTLFVAESGVYTLTAGRAGFGMLPARADVTVTENLSDVNFVLPPANDAMTNGGFEGGDLSGWSSGAGISATLDALAAHTGQYGLRLDGMAPPIRNRRSAVQAGACVTQSLVISSAWASPALSWLYQVVAGDPSDALVVRITDITGATQTVTSSAPLVSGLWTHGWLDLSAFDGEVVEVGICLEGTTAEQGVYVDEVSAGDTGIGVFPRFLPVVWR